MIMKVSLQQEKFKKKDTIKTLISPKKISQEKKTNLNTHIKVIKLLLERETSTDMFLELDTEKKLKKKEKVENSPGKENQTIKRELKSTITLTTISTKLLTQNKIKKMQTLLKKKQKRKKKLRKRKLKEKRRKKQKEKPRKKTKKKKMTRKTKRKRKETKTSTQKPKTN